MADVKVEFLRDEEETEENFLDEFKVKEALETALKESNYSLGGTGLFTSRAAAILASEDFNECIVEGHNDCSSNANCFNTPGSYLCACKDGFKDISDVPGRECAGKHSLSLVCFLVVLAFIYSQALQSDSFIECLVFCNRPKRVRNMVTYILDS